MKVNGNSDRRPPSADGGLADWLDIAPNERAVHVLAQVAIAAVLRSDDQQLALGAARAFETSLLAGGIAATELARYTDSLRAKSNDWWMILSEHSAVLSQERRDLIGIACCTLSLVADECPIDGAGFRRTDAILDLLHVDSSAGEIQRTVDGVVGELLGSQKSLTDQLKGLARTAQVGAEMLTITHPYIGIPAAWGLGRVVDDSDAGAEPPAEAIDAVLSLARVVTFVRNVLEDGTQRAETAAILSDRMRNRAYELGWTGAELPRQASLIDQAKGAWSVLRRRDTPADPVTGFEGTPQELLGTCLVRAASILDTMADPPQKPTNVASSTQVRTK